jgi:ABC-type antimicrobial peptide transport system permease subunit
MADRLSSTVLESSTQNTVFPDILNIPLVLVAIIVVAVLQMRYRDLPHFGAYRLSVVFLDI